MIVYLIFLNIISFLIYGLDKLFSIIKISRVSEFVLLSLSVFGGCFGGLLAMFLFRHKIRKKKFIISNILFVFLWLLFV